MVDIYNHNRRLELVLRRIQNSDISDSNKQNLLRFHRYCIARGLSIAKLNKYLHDLRIMAEWLDIDFETAKKEDIQVLVGKIETSTYAAWTKKGLKIAIKRFYKWLKGDDEEYPYEVKWVKTTLKEHVKKLPEEILSEEEIIKIINAARGERNRAFISVLYESGCRIGEIANLQIKNITFNKWGAVIMVSGKKGARRIPLITSVPYLQEWLNVHPDKDNPDAFLWLKGTKQLATYSRFKTITKEAAQRAGIKKRIYPHLFRHSRATYLANFLTEAQLKEFFGWTQGSSMAAIYVHLSGRDVDNAILKLHGIKAEEKEKPSIFRTQICTRCNERNEATNKFCKKCGIILDEKTRQEIIKQNLKSTKANSFMDKLIKDEEFIEFMKGKIKEFKNKEG